MRLPVPICWLLLLVALPAATQDRDDLMVKAKVAMAIVRFVEFPQSRGEGSPLRFCAARGEGLPRPVVELVRQGGLVNFVELKTEDSPAGCDVLYIGSSLPNWRRLLAASHAGLLTIGDVPGFLAAGGAIELVLTNDAVKFDVNQRELRRLGLRVPAQVLRLARTVQE